MNCWIIALACCVINLLNLGVARLAPLLFVASMTRFNVNRGKASFPYVLCYILRTLSGPLIGYTGSKYGLRAVTLFGCFSSFIGILLCFFAEDLVAVTILWGGVYGFGFGFGTALLPLVLDHAFDDKNKTKGNGLALAGSSLGGIVLPPLLQASLKEYGLSGSFLILAGLILHCVPACLLLSSVNSKKKVVGNQESQRSANLHPHKKCDHEINTENIFKSQNTFYGENESPMQLETNIISQNTSGINSTRGHDNLVFKISDENICSENKKEYPILNKKVTINEHSGEQCMNSVNSLKKTGCKHLPKSIEPPGTPRLLQVTVICENCYINDMLSDQKNYIKGEERTTSEKEKKIPASSLRSFCIFLDPTFILIMFSQSLYAFAVIIIWTIIVDVVRDKGLDRSSQIYCMMFLPFADMIGRVGLGWVTDGGYLSKTKFCEVFFLLLGLFSLFFIWVYSLILILTTVFLFGFASGGLMSVFPSVVCKYITTDNKMMAVSSRMLLLAPLSLTISPLIGYFREQLGSYDGLFYLSCFVFLLCCGMVSLIPRFSRRSKSRN